MSAPRMPSSRVSRSSCESGRACDSVCTGSFEQGGRRCGSLRTVSAKRTKRAPAAELPSLRIGQAAALLGVSVETLRRWEEEGQLRVVRSEGGQRLVDIETVRRLLAARRAPQRRIVRTSARNQLEAVVLQIRKGRAAATVEMQAGPYRLVSLMTAEAVEELQLKPGDRVVACVKATSVMVGRPDE